MEIYVKNRPIKMKNNFKEYAEYKLFVGKFKILQKELNKLTNDYAKINTAYQKYLLDNPYKNEREKLKKEKQEKIKEILSLGY